mmetsp:Transcript_20180/g.25501  ORF Transcript_20180/g.25501 Transcript_20180/m.25501 type:complete len:389 (+) Transcript_20180:61-1227(+)
MTNPNPWPSIENLSKWYASTTKSAEDIGMNHPIALQGRRREEIFVYAYEKVDGTNLGIKCDGTIYGRRTKVADGARSYQNVPLGKHNIPPYDTTLAKVKSSLVSLEQVVTTKLPPNNKKAPELILYGELVCIPERYGYEDRGMKSKWLCFGGILVFDDSNANSNTAQEVFSSLAKKGFLVHRRGAEIVLNMNPTLQSLLEDNGIECPRFVDQGTLKDVCLRQKGLMMKSQLEGLVITGENFITKWKIGDEDESSGLSDLKSLLAEKKVRDEDEDDVDGKRALIVDIELTNCLIEVAGNKTKEKGMKKKKVVNNDYDDDILSKAIISAYSKYDALDTYFSNNDVNTIINALVKELVDDLGASSKGQLRCINKFVGSAIGNAYKKWKNAK